VVLESTLVSHGLPHPENLNVAREAERTVRAEGTANNDRRYRRGGSKRARC